VDVGYHDTIDVGQNLLGIGIRNTKVLKNTINNPDIRCKSLVHCRIKPQNDPSPLWRATPRQAVQAGKRPVFAKATPDRQVMPEEERMNCYLAPAP
jgi:hypothetical protein